ncbi:hypothetical protein BH09VER1_BH09VER1_16140 [soil metagenome]
MPGRVTVYSPPKLEGAAIPERWSFSSLRAFHLCPLRWVLRDVESKPVASLSSIEGELLHRLLQAYFSREKGMKFLQRRTLIGLISAYSEDQGPEGSNIKALLQRVSIQEVLLNFTKALHAVSAAGGGDYVSPRTVTSAGCERAQFRSPADVAGVEKWVEDASLSLCGRLDFYVDGTLIDFKSGARHEWHDDQVRFYCALIYKQTGAVPRRAQVYYTSTAVTVELSVPTPSQCEALLLEYHQMALSAESLLRTGEIKPRPEREYCQFCPNKASCDAYWQNVVPEVLFDPALSIADVSAGGKGTSIESAAYAKVNFTMGGLEVEILFPRHTHRELFETKCDLRECRILKARKKMADGTIFLTLTEQSEVFVQSCSD